MKNIRRVLLSAALLALPGTGTAQLTGHLSIGIGVGTYPAFRSGFGLAPQPGPGSTYLGVGFSAGFGLSAYDDGYGYGHHGGWHHWDDPWDCWHYEWYDPLFGCRPYFAPGLFGPWWGWHRPMWGFYGYLGWPSYRVVHHHWYGYSPWHGGWNWYPDRYRWRWDRYRYRPPVRYVHDPYEDRGYATPRGYRSGGRATSRGYSGDRIVRDSPLFGPRYKEEPRRARVTDSGRNTGGTRGTADDVRRARPRDGTTRSTPPKLRTRPETTTTVRPTPTRRATPRAKPATPRRTTPVVRPPTTRRPSSTARPSTSRATPKARPNTSQRPTTRVRPTTSRRSPPKVRPAPTRRPPARASAPKRAPKPKASPPKRAPKPRASPPKRSAPKPKARPPTRRSGGSKKPPPRRGGKD